MKEFSIHSFLKKQYLEESYSKLNEESLNPYEMEKEDDLQKLVKIINGETGLEFDNSVRGSMSNGKRGYYIRMAGRGNHYFEDNDISNLQKAFEKANKITNKFNYEYGSVSDYETDIDDDRSWAASVSFFAVPKKDKLNENRIDQSKVFDQSEVDEIIGEIREITGILEDDYNSDVGYSEYRFGDGTGGFSFKWSHSRNWGGRFGLSIRENGDPKLSALSWYDKKSSGSENIKSNNTNVQNITTWKDLDNSMLISVWAQLEPMVVQNEINSKAALSKEAKAQADYYGAKADTGRIGYGLTQQPRMRKESVEDVKDLEDRLAQLYREMEQEAEPEGGPISDQYADAIHRIESEIRSLKPKKPTLTYDQAIGREKITDETGTYTMGKNGVKNYIKINPITRDEFEKSSKFDRLNEDLDDPDEDLVIIGSGYLDIKSKFGERPSQTNGEYAEIGQKVVDQLHNGDKEAALDYIISQINEGSCGYTPDGKPRKKPAGPDLLKLEGVIKECWKNYKQIGMKDKGGKQVPNCVPK